MPQSQEQMSEQVPEQISEQMSEQTQEQVPEQSQEQQPKQSLEQMPWPENLLKEDSSQENTNDKLAELARQIAGDQISAYDEDECSSENQSDEEENSLEENVEEENSVEEEQFINQEDEPVSIQSAEPELEEEDGGIIELGESESQKLQADELSETVPAENVSAENVSSVFIEPSPNAQVADFVLESGTGDERKSDEKNSDFEKTEKKSELLGLFKKVNSLRNQLPSDSKDDFMRSKNGAQLDFMLEKLERKPGLLSTAEALRKASFNSLGTTEKLQDIPLSGKPLANAVMEMMTDLSSGFADESLTGEIDSLRAAINLKLKDLNSSSFQKSAV